MVDQNGKQAGIMPTSQALAMARQAGLDLVEVAAKTRPPVCRIMDFGKYQYKQTKKLRKQRVKSKRGETKGIRFTLATAAHDLALKVALAQKFLDKGHKVRIELVLAGRQKMQHDFAREKLQNFLALFAKDSIKVIQPAKRNPRGLMLIIDKIR